jgi:hypothetical protein
MENGMEYPFICINMSVIKSIFIGFCRVERTHNREVERWSAAPMGGFRWGEMPPQI